MTTFNQPTDNGATGGGYFRPADNKGDLILFIEVAHGGTEFDQMANGDREYRIVSYVNLDRDATVVEGAKVTGALTRKLPVGSTNILGRIGQAKTFNGYNAWVLIPHNDKDAKQATEWLKAGKPAKVDPFASLEREAAAIGVTVEQLAMLKKMQADDGKAPF